MIFNSWLFRAHLTARLIGNKMSMRDAAKCSGVSIATISRLAHGELPDIETFAKIIVWLGADANSFFSGTQTTKQPATEQEAWANLYHALEALGAPTDFVEAIVVLVRLVVGKRPIP